MTGMTRAPARGRSRCHAPLGRLDTPNRGRFAPIFSKPLCPSGRYEADSARKTLGVLVTPVAGQVELGLAQLVAVGW